MYLLRNKQFNKLPCYLSPQYGSEQHNFQPKEKHVPHTKKVTLEFERKVAVWQMLKAQQTITKRKFDSIDSELYRLDFESKIAWRNETVIWVTWSPVL